MLVAVTCAHAQNSLHMSCLYCHCLLHLTLDLWGYTEACRYCCIIIICMQKMDGGHVLGSNALQTNRQSQYSHKKWLVTS